MIAIENVSKSFGALQAVRGISFAVNSGEVVGFLGPNGAGKSTTMRMITGFIPPTSGRITIDHDDVTTQRIPCQRKIGYLPESAAVDLESEVTDYLVFMGKMRGLQGNALTQALKRVVQRCQLQKVLGRTIGTLSKGYRQRVGLAQALLHDPAILILDEPTVGLDPNQILEIRELIRDIGKTKTVLLSSHIMQEVTATCQRVIIINDGLIVAQGTPDELAQLAGDQIRYRVRLLGRVANLSAACAKISGLIDVSVIEQTPQFVDAQMCFRGQDDFGAQIFQLAVANGWVLSELVRERQSLENVFHKFTGGAA